MIRDKILLVKPPQWAVIYLFAAAAINFFVPGKPEVSMLRVLCGAGALLGGFFLVLSAWKLLRYAQTPILPTEMPRTLVAKGPYRVTRNPMYLGITLILAGMALLLGGGYAFLAPVAFMLTMEWVFVPYEERNMEAAFGQMYDGYRKRVRRWL